jgi:phenylpropionate dioxygenase-like ring-hydroxylating dioxygenase large terminal subunit
MATESAVMKDGLENAAAPDLAPPEGWDRRGLPAWAYHSDALTALEKSAVFRTHWQIVGHVSDVPEPGDFITLDAVGERALVVRGRDGVVRGFHNICRHRGARVVADETGRCRNALVCPYHGWVYNLDGTLRGPARPETLPELDRVADGLTPLDLEIWRGLVFIRFAPGPQPSVATLLAPVAEEAAHYRMETMVPAGGVWTDTSPVNWKSVRDVDNEGYHVAMAHPALQDLYGHDYRDGPYVDGLARTVARFAREGRRRWSVKHYAALSRPQPWAPEALAQAWLYWGLFPNAVIAVTPESMQFYQEFPVSTHETRLRGAVYRYPEEDRAQRLARRLAARIDRETLAEDVQLTIWSNESMASAAFRGFLLSDLEYGVRTHHDHLRAVLPVLTLDDSPGEDAMAARNAALKAGRAQPASGE